MGKWLVQNIFTLYNLTLSFTQYKSVFTSSIFIQHYIISQIYKNFSHKLNQKKFIFKSFSFNFMEHHKLFFCELFFEFSFDVNSLETNLTEYRSNSIKPKFKIEWSSGGNEIFVTKLFCYSQFVTLLKSSHYSFKNIRMIIESL